MALRSLVSAILVMPLLCPIAAAGETPPFPFTLSKPAGDGPFPAVVILHDCSGLDRVQAACHGVGPAS